MVTGIIIIFFHIGVVRLCSVISTTCIAHYEEVHVNQVQINYKWPTLRMQEEIGSGQFGTVYKGVWLSPGDEGGSEDSQAQEEDRVKFFQEAAIMGQFKHPHVVEMYGMITLSPPVSNMWAAHYNS